MIGAQVALQAYTFTGLTGAHKIELIYVNAWARAS